MKINIRTAAQDGRFSIILRDAEVEIRSSVIPGEYGENIVLRILDPKTGIQGLPDLGFEGRNLKLVKEGLERPFGLILITGPTGSGKSTTLYAMLDSLNQERWNIVSLEDPIEYSIEGMNQSQVRPEIGYDFAEGIRHILRQDPDIMMVGEIRDKETAKLAIHAALTGHLVFSTLHTNNAVGVIPRLIDMGVDPYLIAPTLALVVGQRLVRRLCESSREEVKVEGALREKIEKEIELMPKEARIPVPHVIYRPKSSPDCPKGTRGRMAVFEVLEMNKDLEKLILTTPSDAQVEQEALRQGMITMRQNGIMRVAEGKIGLEELFEVI